MTSASRPRVYIVGGGFGGLAAAKALAGAAVDVTVIDRRNHHVFQPLLYQVATAALAPSDIASPIRTVLRRQKNTQVALAEVTGVDLAQHRLVVPNGHATYDFLILAAGATHAYFGHHDWAPIAPGLKTLEDATELRRRMLLAFEAAEYEGNEEARRAALTFGIVGGGPTGVELAGAIKEIAGRTIPRDYRHIDTRTTRVILFEAGGRLLPTFAPPLGARAQRDLERMGVEVRLNSTVTGITASGIDIPSQFISMRNVFWAAGVQASSLGRSLGVPLDRAGRVIVGADLTVPGHPEVFVVGDMAAATSADTGRPVPGVAQGGIQMGRYAGEMVARVVGGDSRTPRQAFVYRDKGSMAVIGKAKAVAQIGRFQFGGFVAWLLWGGVHILSLVGYRNRVQVSLSWLWNWVLNTRDARLITGDARLDIHAPRSTEFIAVDAAASFPAGGAVSDSEPSSH
jgi:NADH dehydrogenase